MKTPQSTEKTGALWPLWVILLLAFLFRFLFLALKPPHFDEGINGWFVDQLIMKGYYPYDPTNYHGPFHFYVLLLFKVLMGRNLWALRVPSAFFGFLGVYLIARFERYVGRFTAWTAALFAAVSPGMIFYSRYAIHESELFFFSLLALHGFLRYRAQKDKTSLWQLGLGLTGMVITKETFIIHLGCFALAWFCLRFYEQRVLKSRSQSLTGGGFSSVGEVEVLPRYTRRDLNIITGVCVLIFILFYSGFFLHWEGVVDFFRSFLPWFQTGKKGNGHEKVFYYWLTLFWRYELAAMVGLVYSFFLVLPLRVRWLTRLMAVYGVGVLLVYSIVPYKTPWCVMNILWPFFITAGGLLNDIVVERQKLPRVAWAGLAIASLAGIFKSYDLNFVKYTDEQEPYVYVQTFSDIMRVNSMVMKLVKANPARYHMSIKLFMDSHWPIPWLWGDFTNVGYYGFQGPVSNPDAALIIVDARAKNLVESELNKSYFVEPFRLRSAQEPGYVYYDMNIFRDFFDSKATVFKPKPMEPLKPGEGLLAEYYQNADWSGVPVMKKVEAKPDFSMEDPQRPLPAPWSLIYSGEIMIPESGVRTFFLTSDDGSELAIDGQVVVTNLGVHAQQQKSGAGTFKKGWHKIRIRYNDYGGGMILHLSWLHSPGFQEEIPSKFFKQAGGDHSK